MTQKMKNNQKIPFFTKCLALTQSFINKTKIFYEDINRKMYIVFRINNILVRGEAKSLKMHFNCAAACYLFTPDCCRRYYKQLS